MIDATEYRDPVEVLAEEFSTRRRQGQSPSMEEYIERYPAYSDRIRLLFPMLAMLEETAKPAAPPRPEHLGEYQILREIGRGGMGVIYEAVQSSLDRHVALKVLPHHLIARPDIRTRFLREARTAAALHHSHIVPVYGVGEEGGICFFVMQRIEGISFDRILHYLRLDKGKAASTLNNLKDESTSQLTTKKTPVDQPAANPTLSQSHQLTIEHWRQFSFDERCRRVARIGVQIADALAYAHQQGVLHRDIKPGNILIDRDEHSWLNDFGLARAVQADDLTATGQVVGTMRYLAPERFLGDSSPQSDLYALGMTLYELIALETAFPGNDHAELVQQIHYVEPAPLSKSHPEVPRDLDTIVMKCLAKLPAQRYATAEALSQDLLAFLAGEPIQARPLRWWEKTGRWMKRNPVVASLSMAFVTLLIVGMATVTALYFRSEEHRLDAVQKSGALALERNQVREQRDVAQANLTDALGAVERFYTKVSQNVLFEKPGFDALRKDLLTEAINYYQGFLRRHENNPTLQAEVAKAQYNRASLMLQIGKKAEAEAGFRQTLEYYRQQTLQPNPSVADRLNLVEVSTLLIESLEFQGKLLESERAIREALEQIDVLKSASVPDSRVDIYHAKLTHASAENHEKSGRFDEAERDYTTADAHFRDLTNLHPNEVRYRAEWIRMQLDFGSFLYSQRQQPKRAIPLLESAYVQLQAKVAEGNPSRRTTRDLARCCNILATSYSDANEPDKASPLFEQSMQLHEELVQLHPGVTNYSVGLANAHRLMGYSLQKKNRLNEAQQELLHAERMFQQLVEKDESDDYVLNALATTQSDLARVVASLHGQEKSLDFYARAIVTWQKYRQRSPIKSSTAENHWNYAGTLNNLALCYGRQQNYVEAEKYYRLAVEEESEALRKKPNFTAAHNYMLIHRFGLGRSLRELGRIPEAMDEFATLLTMCKNDATNTVNASRDLATCLKLLKPGDSERQRCQRLALEGLRQAQSLKFRNVKIFDTEPAWAVLKDNADFQAIVAELKADVGK